MKKKDEDQIEIMLTDFSDKLYYLVSDYKKEKSSSTSDMAVDNRTVIYIDEIYQSTERYVRAKVVSFIPITFAKTCMENIYIQYIESLNASSSNSKEEVLQHFQKTVDSQIDKEIAQIAKYEMDKLESVRAMDLEETEKFDKILDIKMTKEDALDLLDKLLSHLPDFCAYDISLYYVQKLSIPEIAKRTNVSIERVNKKLDFGRQHIKNQLRIMQSNGEIDTFHLPLQKFFDWLVEFETTDEVLNTVKNRLKLSSQNNIDYTTVKQRYKNVLLGSYEEDTQMNQAFERRLHKKKDEFEEREEFHTDENIVIADKPDTVEKKSTEVTDEKNTNVKKDGIHSDVDVFSSKNEKLDNSKSDNIKEPHPKTNEVSSQDKDVKNHEFNSIKDVEEDKILPENEVVEIQFEADEVIERQENIEEQSDEDVSEKKSSSTAIEEPEDDFTMIVDLDEEDATETEKDTEKSERNIIVLLLSLIGIVGITIIYYLVHLLL